MVVVRKKSVRPAIKTNANVELSKELDRFLNNIRAIKEKLKADQKKTYT